MNVGDRLRDHRTRSGLTQRELATLAGVSERSLRDIEHGRVATPQAATVRRLADALQLGADERDRLSAPPTLAVGILGPLTVDRSGQRVPVAAGAAGHLLGLLALESDRFVTVDEIADVLWGARPPSGWRNRIHVHVGRVRELLEPGRQSGVLTGRRGEYRLELPHPEQLDARRFGHLVGRAEQADVRAAIALYQEALACWRGPVLLGDDGRLSGRPSAEGLRRARLSATLALADAASRAGRPGQAVPWLEQVAGEEPLHEGVHGRLMAAWARTGRQDSALRLYGRLRTRLADELGVDPSAEIQAVYRDVLGRGHLDRAAGPPMPRPAQLPMATMLFAGRDDLEVLLMGHLTGPRRPSEIPSPRVVVLHGMAGVGKTELALQVGHRIRHCYPDGQLFADLRGEREHPADAAQVLAGFLRALGVAPQRIPGDPAERSAMLRSHLAGRRILMMLDDVGTASQVTALLPSDSGNDVLITSRGPLPELPVTRYRLEPLPLDGALSLLARLLPSERLDDEPGAAAEIAEYCAGLPLALRIAASRSQREVGLKDIARLLRDVDRRVGELHTGEQAIQASLDSCDRKLSGPARTALRRLAALPTGAFPSWAVRVVMACSASDATRILAELSDTHLTNAPSGKGGHHSLHDLVRLYARRDVTPTDERAVGDVVLHWFRLAEAASRQMTSRVLSTDALGLAAATLPPGTAPVDPRVWFDRHHRHLLDLIRYAGDTGQARLAVALLTVTIPYLRTRYLTDEWRQALDVVLAAVRRTGDAHAEAYGWNCAALLAIVEADHAAATVLVERGLAWFTAEREPHNRNRLLYDLQYLKRRQGDTAGAEDTAATLLRCARETSDPVGEAAAHHALGVVYRDYLNDLDRARHHLERALEITASEPMSRERSQISFGLASVYLRQGTPGPAEELLNRALEVARSRDDQSGVLSCLNRLANLWPAPAATEAIREALAIAHRIGQPDTIALVHEAWARSAERFGEFEESIGHMRKAADLFAQLQAPSALAEAEAHIARLTGRRTVG
ncbi:BTAD domain-containing putative transcriptional regulator [Longispora sp. NPDC051575]|uniref:BTAD domain-containing putative transcriptional regulator n=1 Tax=Longispora sp. NPDC051575 TaxID=3154943 RepID=UPI0034327F80